LERLLSFLRRLDEHRTEYWIEKCPAGDAIRVHTWAANERWEIDFWRNGEVEAECFRSDPRGEVGGEELLERLFGRLEEAWSLAARDLHVEFVSPFFLARESGNDVRCAGYLPHFGGPQGTVIISRQDPEEASALADAQGYHVSGLNPRYYENYDRDRFQATLSEWGWYGPADVRRPEWLAPDPEDSR
jgi:hypothetical protein